ncbi:hypothetical protein M407DRAFT_232998 [Tulasnella calospora MUT 4182]|uniref:Uncharacterized protein n=1 Tax=Tulasnella calospora MUT 4182 TaxID=1051891 RepID=A0A0C3K451_9AGAM|nr:hypothetical protein M407DRAFT_232998 [Tulasnella calospora MUT 4182]
MRWESPILRGVETLEIGGLGSALRLSQLLAILPGNTQLKQLLLSVADIQTDVLAPAKSKIVLCRMEVLRLSKTSGNVAEILLENIDVPVCRNLHLEIDMSKFAAPQFLSGTMLQFRAQICDSIVRGSKSQVKALDMYRGSLHRPWNIPRKGPPIAPNFHFRFSGCSAESMWSWIEEVHLGLPNKVGLILEDQDLEGQISALERMTKSPVMGSLFLSEDGAYYPTALELLGRALPVDTKTSGQKGFSSLTEVGPQAEILAWRSSKSCSADNTNLFHHPSTSSYGNCIHYTMSLLQNLIEKAVGDLVQSVQTLRNETYP